MRVGWGVGRTPPQAPCFPPTPHPTRRAARSSALGLQAHLRRPRPRTRKGCPPPAPGVRREARLYTRTLHKDEHPTPARQTHLTRQRTQRCTRTRTLAFTHAHVYPSSVRPHVHTHTRGAAPVWTLNADLRALTRLSPAQRLAGRRAHTRTPAPRALPARVLGSPAPRLPAPAAAGAVRRGGTGRGRRPGARRRRSRSREPAGPRPSCRPGIFQPGR